MFPAGLHELEDEMVSADIDSDHLVAVKLWICDAACCRWPAVLEYSLDVHWQRKLTDRPRVRVFKLLSARQGLITRTTRRIVANDNVQKVSYWVDLQ